MEKQVVVIKLECDCEFCAVPREDTKSYDTFCGDSVKEARQLAKADGWKFSIFSRRVYAPGHF